MDMTQKISNMPTIMRQIMNLLLVLITLALSVVTFFVVQEIVLIIANHLILTSAHITVRQNNALATIRNFSAIISGLTLLSFLVFTVDYHTRRLEKPQTSKILLWTLLVEIIIIVIRLII